MYVLYAMGGILSYAFHAVMFNLFQKKEVLDFHVLNLFLCPKFWLIRFSNEMFNFYISAKFRRF